MHKATTGIEALLKDFDLFRQLVASGTTALRLSCNESYQVRRHVKHRDRRQDVGKRQEEFLFDHLDGDVVNKSLQSNLLKVSEYKSKFIPICGYLLTP